MNDNLEARNTQIVKWLQLLRITAAVSLANSVISLLPFVPAAVTATIAWCIMLMAVICMLKLGPIHARYQKAGILRAVMLGCTLITSIFHTFSILTLAASIVSFFSVYQEYTAHSELVADMDPILSRRWHTLFNWGIVSAVLVAFGSLVAVLIAVMLDADAVRIAAVIACVLQIPQFVIEVIYLLYLKKEIAFFRQ